jgi:hypothetical protein
MQGKYLIFVISISSKYLKISKSKNHWFQLFGKNQIKKTISFKYFKNFKELTKTNHILGDYLILSKF